MLPSDISVELSMSMQIWASVLIGRNHLAAQRGQSPANNMNASLARLIGIQADYKQKNEQMAAVMTFTTGRWPNRVRSSMLSDSRRLSQ